MLVAAKREIALARCAACVRRRTFSSRFDGLYLLPRSRGRPIEDLRRTLRPNDLAGKSTTYERRSRRTLLFAVNVTPTNKVCRAFFASRKVDVDGKLLRWFWPSYARHLPDRVQARLPFDQPARPATHLKFNRARFIERACRCCRTRPHLRAYRDLARKALPVP
jgi:hypothetical protein